MTSTDTPTTNETIEAVANVELRNVLVRRGKKTEPVIDIEKEKKRRGPLPGTHIRALWRYKENGKYDARACDPDYYNKYYAAKRKGVYKCEKCGCEYTNKGTLTMHERGQTKCLRIQALMKLQEEQERLQIDESLLVFNN